MSRISSLLFSAALIAISGSSFAQELTRSTLEFGSSREALHAILLERPRGGARLAYSLADSLALNPDRKSYPYVISVNWGVSPALRYEGNINGGIEADTIYIWGLPFTVTDASKAKGAWTIGAAVSASARVAISKGIAFQALARSELRGALGGENFIAFENSLSAQLSFTSEKISYAAVNAALMRRDTDYSDSKVKSYGFTVGKVFGKNAVHDLSFGFSRVDDGDTTQNRTELTWSLTQSELGNITFGLQAGQSINGEMLFSHGITVAYSNFILKQPTTLSLSASVSDGGSVFGDAREDKVYTARIERKVSKKLNGYLSLTRRDSSVDTFDSNTINAGFVLRNISF